MQNYTVVVVVVADLVSGESSKPAPIGVSDWCNNWSYVARVK